MSVQFCCGLNVLNYVERKILRGPVPHGIASWAT